MKAAGFIAPAMFQADIQRRIAVDWRQTPVIILAAGWISPVSF